MEGLARSPVFAVMSEALNGISSIRPNDAMGYYRRKFFAAHDVSVPISGGQSSMPH